MLARRPVDEPGGRRLSLSPLGVAEAAAILMFFGLSTFRFLIAPLDRYDEGVTLTKPMLVLAGRIPYRDFWATYGPLDTYMLAAGFKLFAVNVVVERLLGALTVVAMAVLAYLVLTRLRLRGAMRLLLTGLIAMVPLSVPAFNSAFLANVVGLAAVLAFLVSLERKAWRWPATAGAMVGLSSFARPEYAVALGTGLLLGYVVLAWPGGKDEGDRRMLLVYGVSTVLVAGLLWGPMALAAGIQPIWLDMVTYAMDLYPKARSIPFGRGPEGAVVIVFSVAFLLIWTWGVLHAVRHRTQQREQLAKTIAFLVAGIALFTWVRTRADGIHAFDAWPLTAVLLAVLLASRRRRQVQLPRMDAAVGIAGILLFAVGAGGLGLRDYLLPHEDSGIPRSGISGGRAWMPTDELAGTLRAIDDTVPRGAFVWVGLHRNDLITFNDTVLYFLADRQPGTVYFEQLPGFTNSTRMEHVIECQLERAQVRLVVLGPDSAGEPWNLSSVPGSSDLDRWIAGHAADRSTIGPYELVKLMPGPPSAPEC